MNKYAVLIGINDYQDLGDLQFAVSDVQAFSDSLQRNYGFKPEEITVMTSDSPEQSLQPLNPASIKSQLDRVREIFIAKKEPLDLLVFGFWGHGLWAKDKVGQERRFLCPMGFNERPEYFFDTALPLADVQEKLSSIPAKDTWVVLDCCQNDFSGARSAGAAMSEQEQASLEFLARDIGIRRKEEYSTSNDVREFGNLDGVTLIFNSCSKGQKAYEWPEKRHGLFTYYLLEAMNKRIVSAADVYRYSKAAMPTAPLCKNQTPYSTSAGGLDIQLPAVKSASVPYGDVFISYCHKNADLAATIEAELQRKGISFFIDREGIDYGERFAEIISDAIERCKTFLFIWTKEANDSEDMKRELVLAQQKGKRILPYRVGTFNPTKGGLAYHLAGISRYDVRESSPVSVLELVRWIEREGGEAPPPPTKTKLWRFLLLLVVAVCLGLGAMQWFKGSVVVKIKEQITLVESLIEKTNSQIDGMKIIDPTSERDKYSDQFLNNIQGTGQTSQQVIDRINNKTNTGEKSVWFQNAEKTWTQWFDIELKYLKTTLQKERLEANILKLRQYQDELKRAEENVNDYTLDILLKMETDIQKLTLKAGEDLPNVELSKLKDNAHEKMVQHVIKIEKERKEQERKEQELQAKIKSLQTSVESKITDANSIISGLIFSESVNERDKYSDQFLNNIQGTGQTSQQVIDRINNKTDTGEKFEWFQNAEKTWTQWFDIELKYLKTTLQKERLEANILKLRQYQDELKRAEENVNDYTLDILLKMETDIQKLTLKAGEDLPNVELSKLKDNAHEKMVQHVNKKERFIGSWKQSDNRLAGTRNAFTVKGIEFAFRWCPPGQFKMGELEDDDEDERPIVRLTKGFWIMENEITQAQWEAIMGSNPSKFKGNDLLPVENVSWDACQIFCIELNRISLMFPFQLQLPSEAQWEYACRAGNFGPYAGDLKSMAWYEKNSNDKTHPVKVKIANTWGLYDMHGNVWEWCQDAWEKDISSTRTEQPLYGSSDSDRVYRGGGLRSDSKRCRYACRDKDEASYRIYDIGFRCVIVP